MTLWTRHEAVKEREGAAAVENSMDIFFIKDSF